MDYSTMVATKAFHHLVLHWFDCHGRHDLPWQKNQTPYRVWVSEIMLQQTQVATVIPYYQKFMRRFPSLKSLAQAPSDEVLHHWSGLGYYARARNLQRCAITIMERHGGRFPKDLDALQALPGIGRSTAGAIASLAMKTPAPILDGNVKRVLARCFAIEGWPGTSSILKQLWETASQLTPMQRCHDYNQAMMDLGALICTRSSPRCDQCPLNSRCLAYHQGSQLKFPGKKPVTARRREKATYMLILQNTAMEVLLEKRPTQGLWGGLWSFPEVSHVKDIEKFCSSFGVSVSASYELPSFKHVFSHFDLTITPVLMSIEPSVPRLIMDSSRYIWYNTSASAPGGIPAPVARLFQSITELCKTV